MKENYGFNFLFFKRSFRLFHVFLPLSRLSLNVHQSHERFYSHPLFLILLILINESALQFVISRVLLIPSGFYELLPKPAAERDPVAFRWLVIRSFAWVALDAFLISLSKLLSSLLYIKWRIRLVAYLHSLYFTRQRYYHVSNTTQQNDNRRDNDRVLIYENYAIQTTDVDDNNQDVIDHPSSISTKPSIDNPDQRIVEDADNLCRTLSNIVSLVLLSPFIIAYYIYQTWIITGFYGPLSIVVYFLLWTCVNKLFISGVSRTIFEQNIREGNFRFLHAQIRTYHEPIALYNGGSYEHQRFDRYFLYQITPLLYRRSIQEFFLSLSTNLYDYIGSILVYLLLALVIFVFHVYDHLSSTELFKTISATASIMGYLIYRFNLLNDIADKATVIAANTHRVQTFVEYMKQIDTNDSERSTRRTMDDEEVLTIKNLSYSTPNNSKHILMKNLNLTLNKGQHLLITGESGVGKTSLFRVLHSIWPVNIRGTFAYQSARSFLLPQRPYFTNQSLHDELTYPDVEYHPNVNRQSEIEQILLEWNLSHLLDHVNLNVFTPPKYAWPDLLSPGELQRLSFLRLLLRLSSPSPSKINLVFLDEITSSLDFHTEKKIYHYLSEQSDVTFLSITHRATLRVYHRMELKLYQNSRYVIEELHPTEEIITQD